MGPIELLKLFSLYEKFKTISQEKGTFPMKLAHYLTLLSTLSTTLGLPTLAANWVHLHLKVYMVLVAIAIVLHAIFPSIFSAPSDADKKTSGLGGVGMLILAFFVLSFGPSSFAQTTTPTPAPAPASSSAAPTSFYAVGASGNTGGSPAIAGTALYAHAVSGSGTYAFTVVDALPNSLKPFTVTTNISAGVAQQVFTLKNIPILVPTSAGISFTGSNTGWAWSTGGTAVIKLKGSWYLFPTVRVAKSSVSNGTGYQLIPGLLIGWGQ